MRGGFTFCGVDIADLGLEYAPDNTDMYVFRSGEFKINEQIFDGHHGGYFYGSTVSPKAFTLRCFFEAQHINTGIMTRINQLFSRGRSGRLVFARRPWIWYAATVTNTVATQFTNYENGIIAIQMKAYYPFGRCDELSLLPEQETDSVILGNSALLPESITPTVCAIDAGSEMTTATELLLYNGGTERAAVAIEIAGNIGEGVTIVNATTNQSCRFVSITKAQTSDAGKYIVCDGMNGKTLLTNGISGELAFLYHDYGFIDLEPAFPILRDLNISYTANGAAVVCDSDAFLGQTGKYLHLDGQWRKIVAVDDGRHASVLPTPTSTGKEKTPLVTMNEIVVTPSSDMALTRLNFRFKPTFE